MPEHQDPLSQLWQEQQVEKPDLAAISKKWRQMRLKQRLYACLDIAGLAFPTLVLYFNLDKLDMFTLVYFAVLIAVFCPFVGYILWLRRFSMSWSSTTTEQHFQTLRRQIRNNIRIAFITKHSSWVSGLLVTFHYTGLFYFEVFEVEQLIRKSLITAGMLAVLLPLCWIWAARRETKFKNELIGLDKVFSR